MEMNLSKFFKKTEIFQSEKIISTAKSPTDWKTNDLLHRETEDVFSPRDFHDEASQTLQNDLKQQKEHEKKIQKEKNRTLKAQQAPVETDTKVIQNKETAPIPQVSFNKEELDKKISEALEKGKEEGFSKGYQEGLNKGTLQGQKNISPKYDSIIKALTVVCQQVETYRDNIIENSAQQMQDATLAFVEKIVRFSVKHNDATILLTLEEGLQKAIKSSEFCIHINPEDYDIVQENSESFITTISGLESIILKKDATIERGGTYIESDNCIVDATISSQLEEIYNKFKL